MMIVDIPEAIAGEVGTLLPEQQARKRRRLAEYTLGLIVKDGKKSISAINGLYMNTCDQSNLNRALNSSLWNPNILNLRRISRYTKNKAGGIVIIDDTLQKKWGKKIEGIGSFYDTSEKRYIKGHNFVTSLYVNNEEEIPLFAQPYLKEDDVPSLNATFHSKIEIACWFIEWTCIVLKPSFLAIDSWYFADVIVKKAESYGIIWVADAKGNRVIFVDGKRTSIENYAVTIPISDYIEIPRKTDDDEDKLYKYVAEKHYR